MRDSSTTSSLTKLQYGPILMWLHYNLPYYMIGLCTNNTMQLESAFAAVSQMRTATNGCSILVYVQVSVHLRLILTYFMTAEPAANKASYAKHCFISIWRSDKR